MEIGNMILLEIALRITMEALIMKLILSSLNIDSAIISTMIKLSLKPIKQ